MCGINATTDFSLHMTLESVHGQPNLQEKLAVHKVLGRYHIQDEGKLVTTFKLMVNATAKQSKEAQTKAT